MKHTALHLLFVLTLLTALLAAGCANSASSARPAYSTVSVDPGRDTAAAQRHNQRGLDLLARGEIDKAHDAFTDALTADVEYGPAHNNLGKVHFIRKDWYRAAWEFEYARKLSPRQAEPANNLGLVLEQSGELDRAIESYRQAVAFEPDRLEFSGNLVRALIRRGERTEETRQLLQRLAQNDPRPEWQAWARQQLTLMPSPR